MQTNAANNRSLIENIRIAAPCNVSWDSMVGDQTTRLCGGCAKNVYNISAMSQSEAEALLCLQAELPCLKFYRRHDGTIIFDNCPKELRRLRDSARRTWKIAALFFAFFTSSLSAFAQQKDDTALPHNFNMLWTLSEAGPAERSPMQPGHIPKAAVLPSGFLGSVDRYTYFDQTNPSPTKNLGADWSGSEAFSKALQLEKQKKFSEAQLAFETALLATSGEAHDPIYREFVGSQYAKFLERIGKFKKAKEIIAQTKCTLPITHKEFEH